jgi:hypothetical protein
MSAPAGIAAWRRLVFVSQVILKVLLKLAVWVEQKAHLVDLLEVIGGLVTRLVDTTPTLEPTQTSQASNDPKATGQPPMAEMEHQ